ncbi:head maturation protease, ClpP-related [Bacillus sp. JJ1474]|uniref:head maturation protease, ClpP-related n=1 Tax=Bacillus sp. JJ1474 TaxID=3122955 RepID=UPI003000E574
MKTIEVKGVIVLNDYKEVYEWFGYECTSPNDVINQLPKDNSPVEVIINSGGGHVDAGNEIYARLKGYQGEVTTKTYSLAASAASIIAMASNNGGKTLIAPTAQFMIHNVSGLSEGDYRSHVKEAQVLENYNKAIATAYTLKTGKTEEDILQMMNDETWLNAQQAVEYNFADRILFDEKTQFVASVNSGILPQSVVDKARQMMKMNSGISNDQLDYIVNQVTERFKQNITFKNEPSKRRGFIF